MSRLWTGLVLVVYVMWPELSFAQTVVANPEARVTAKTHESSDRRTASAIASPNPSCNPEVYDRIYKAIVINSINGFFDDDFHDRNASIQALRELCFGQRSTFETTKVTAGN